MGKGAELWDDSALINAFDAAMASYKEVHMKSLSGHAKEKDESIKNESDTVPSKEKDPKNSKKSDGVFLEDSKSEKKIEKEGGSHDVDNNMKETCGSSCARSATINDPIIQPKDIGNNSAASEFNELIYDHPYVNPRFDGYSDHQILNYNELLKQFHELERKKEKIVEQLWQANDWNYQTPVHCYASQGQHVPVSSASEHGPNITCPWCTCHCLTTTSTPISTCPMASALPVGYTCCPQQIYCSDPQVQQEAGENRGEHDESRSIFKSKELSSTDPDLTSVLNAWYWAGYKTGRYLLKQEQAKQAKQ